MNQETSLQTTDSLNESVGTTTVQTTEMKQQKNKGLNEFKRVSVDAQIKNATDCVRLDILSAVLVDQANALFTNISETTGNIRIDTNQISPAFWYDSHCFFT